MRLSKKTIYAIILMLSIVKWEESEVITIKKVAERENLSVKYLEQVVSVLCKSGFVRAREVQRVDIDFLKHQNNILWVAL